MLVQSMTTDFPAKIQSVVDDFIATELESVRTRLLACLLDHDADLEVFAELGAVHLTRQLKIDRVFVCDTASGEIVAGWGRGKNVVNTEDWPEDYRPLEMDETLMQALEGDDLIANPVPGVGADFAMPLRLDDGRLWLMVFDETETAREFSNRDLAHTYLVRDLLLIKARLVASGALASAP